MSLDTPVLPRSGLDPFGIDFFDDPYPEHEKLREAGPVVWLERYGVHGIARYAEVHRVLNDWAAFCSSRGVGLQDFRRETPWRPPSLVLETDPPEHDRARKVLARVLSPLTMRELRDGFAEAADALIAGLVGREIDGIGDLAEAFPLSVFPDRIGLAREGREHLLPYAGLAFNAFGPDNALRREAMARAAPHVAWVTEQCRRENLSPDGLGARIHAAADSGEVTPDEAVLLVRSLLTAGIDTTVNGIGAALYCLARFPDQFQALRADPKRARNAFEEAVRFESPVQTFFRTTTRAVELGGATIPEGSKVLMFLASANRDPRRWDRPDQYDIARKTSGHVGFGSGIHMCVGQLVARLEGEVVLEALARHADAIEIAGPPVRSYNNTLRGLARLPLRIR
ncbi:cytochrome P450 [Paracoccus sp. PS-1]|uniref:cytochrome P450 n=1 Tax=unclassified Paracoccus (in: a-proteobacteria) TaxID=2688777 RepID=UPI00048F651E|nr:MULTISPECIES: cytochrome P450 [unclassified Paracoccus (in: a-proteobacteria)]MDQ7263079.1 cytochrome P450 [Paracoccus sp. PS1]